VPSPPVQRPPLPLDASLDGELADPIEVGAGTAILVRGRCPLPEASEPTLRLGAASVRVAAWSMPAPGRMGRGDRWWAVLPIESEAATGETDLRLECETPSGPAGATLATVTVATRDAELGPVPPSVPSGAPGEAPLIAVCMATHEPRRSHFKVQLESIRAQDWPNWICVISDDASSAEGAALIAELVGEDPRFFVSRSPRRLGFYRNFERVLRMAPAEAGFVALADQDDRWDADKLSSLHAELERNPRAALVYSDMRLVDDRGTLIADTSWVIRRNSWTDIGSLLVANTVTGAASLVRSELLNVALPFPPATGTPYHDHWLALCALADGEIAYLDRATYDHVRHADSVTVRARHGLLAPIGRTARWRLRLAGAYERLTSRGLRPGWRSVYFERYLLLVQFAVTLRLRYRAGITRDRARTLARLERAESSLAGPVWLLLRSFRPYLGRNETLARERVILGGIIWRRLAGAMAGRGRRRQSR
jgi:glycosyltransferase involved in cell wall biosynthesis